MAHPGWDFHRHEGKPYPVRITPEQVEALLRRDPPHGELPGRDYSEYVPYDFECGFLIVYLKHERCGALFPRGYAWLIIHDPAMFYPLVDLGTESDILADPRLAPRQPSE